MSSDKYAALDAAIIKSVSASGKAGIKFSELLDGPAGSVAVWVLAEGGDA